MSRALNDVIKNTSTLFTNANEISTLSQTCGDAIGATIGGDISLPDTALGDAIASVGLADNSVLDVGNFNVNFVDFTGELTNTQEYVTQYR